MRNHLVSFSNVDRIVVRASDLAPNVSSAVADRVVAKLRARRAGQDVEADVNACGRVDYREVR